MKSRRNIFWLVFGCALGPVAYVNIQHQWTRATPWFVDAGLSHTATFIRLAIHSSIGAAIAGALIAFPLGFLASKDALLVALAPCAAVAGILAYTGLSAANPFTYATLTAEVVVLLLTALLSARTGARLHTTRNEK